MGLRGQTDICRAGRLPRQDIAWPLPWPDCRGCSPERGRGESAQRLRNSRELSLPPPLRRRRRRHSALSKTPGHRQPGAKLHRACEPPGKHVEGLDKTPNTAANRIESHVIRCVSSLPRGVEHTGQAAARQENSSTFLYKYGLRCLFCVAALVLVHYAEATGCLFSQGVGCRNREAGVTRASHRRRFFQLSPVKPSRDRGAANDLRRGQEQPHRPGTGDLADHRSPAHHQHSSQARHFQQGGCGVEDVALVDEKESATHGQLETGPRHKNVNLAI